MTRRQSLNRQKAEFFSDGVLSLGTLVMMTIVEGEQLAVAGSHLQVQQFEMMDLLQLHIVKLLAQNHSENR